MTGPAPASETDHATWDRLLRAYVDARGRVAYRDLRARDLPALASYLHTLASATPPADASNEAKAFWINAYNAGIFAAVLQGYSAESFLRRRSLFKGFRFEVAGQPRTLDEIEHEIVRPRFRDPRTHFALVCASSSCPRLRRAAYVAATLDGALDEEARRFVNDPTRNVIDPARGVVRLSSIFSWFAEDFSAAAGSVAAFVGRYLEGEKERALLATEAGTFAYLDYDWTLNAQEGQRP